MQRNNLKDYYCFEDDAHSRPILVNSEMYFHFYKFILQPLTKVIVIQEF